MKSRFQAGKAGRVPAPPEKRFPINHDGRNKTRHIPAAILDRVREGTVGHQRFVALADEFAERRGREALGDAAADGSSKKKRTRP